MSVNFNVRVLNEKLLGTLRRDPSLTTALCDFLLDFDPAAFESEFVAATSPEQRVSQRASFEMKRQRMLDGQSSALSSLLGAGLSVGDLGTALHLERSYWGMESMIGAAGGHLLLDEEEGIELGDDVGYGPARLLDAHTLPGILVDLDRVTREIAEPRFRIQEVADQAAKRAHGLGVPPTSSDADFDRWSWQPFCKLRELVRAAVVSKSWLLKWYD